MSKSAALPANWRLFATADEVAEFAVSRMIACANEAIQKRNAFHLVTAGGTTPMSIYTKLAALQHATDWHKWHIYMGDERCLPAEHAERNSLAIAEAWLNQSPIPNPQIHYMAAEKGALQAAKEYAPLVRNRQFDMVLLGMGEDGHTASLFPGHDHSQEAKDAITGRWVQCEFNSPKPPAERVTLSAESLSNCRHLLKLITGKGKRQAVTKWLAGETLPISEINGAQTSVLLSQESLPE
ncbi:6-phosphogluconolactonase [Thiomicrorhabdus cannonii]|uniref:6-phosphogluconolactonase n=1 Tax=Thiomicrorhabdus cannonii TaxID=2748011 RepID=UPI0031B57F25